MTAYWRQAGISYLKYVNICSDLVRNAMKVRFFRILVFNYAF